MTKDEIYNQCVKISGGLSPAAYEARSLAFKCYLTRRTWRKDVDNWENQVAYTEAALALEKYCKGNKHILSEVQKAYQKIEKLISAASPGSTVADKQKIEALKRKIDYLKSPEGKKTADNYKLLKCSKVAIGVFAVLTVAAFICNIIMGGFFRMMQGTFFMCTIAASVIAAVISRKHNEKIAVLEAELRSYERIEKQDMKDIMHDAVREEYMYDLIIKGIGGASLVDFG